MRAHREGRIRAASVGAAVIVFLCLATTIGYPWGSKGHRIINLNAVMQLPNSMAALKADSVFYEAHSTDADSRKSSSDTTFFAEAQRHFIDIDAYPGYLHLPHSRDSVVALYGWETAKRNGTLPWATQLVLDSLTAQLGRSDTTAKYTMSDLGHYVADAHQPLHCAVNYDGQYTNNNGIHSRYETGMINSYAALLLIRPDSIHYINAPLDFMFAYVAHANSLVDSILHADTYAKASSGWNGAGVPSSSYYTALWEKTQRLTEDQFQQATIALASLWYTAWVNAARSTSVHQLAEVLPEGFRLDQNFPNPFNPSTTITYGLPRASHVTLTVYDVLGREVATLVNGVKQPGTYTVQFDGSGLASRVYFYRLTAGDFVQTKKLLLLR